MQVAHYKFSNTAIENPPDILNGKTPIEFLRQKYVRGSIYGLDLLQRYGIYKYLGWAFDFTPFMKKFLVKQYDNWDECYAINKTHLRNSIYGRIQKIVEIA